MLLGVNLILNMPMADERTEHERTFWLRLKVCLLVTWEAAPGLMEKDIFNLFLNISIFEGVG